MPLCEITLSATRADGYHRQRLIQTAASRLRHGLVVGWDQAKIGDPEGKNAGSNHSSWFNTVPAPFSGILEISGVAFLGSAAQSSHGRPLAIMMLPLIYGLGQQARSDLTGIF
jgi:hypothetical protein